MDIRVLSLALLACLCLSACSETDRVEEKEGGALRDALPQELTLDLGGGVTMKLVLIPAGQFMMGSPASEKGRDSDEGPQRQVTISRAFHMGIHEVMRGQFARFVADSGYKTDAEKDGCSYVWDGSKWDKVKGASWRKPGFAQDDSHPVVCVSHNDAIAFCQWLSRRTGRAVRLPTEAQWEYACRAGMSGAYAWGDDPDHGRGWCNSADQTAKGQFPRWTVFNWTDGYVWTAPVGQFKVNAFGLYDMHGNVYEWCADWYDKVYYANARGQAPPGPDSGPKRVLRGGSWIVDPGYCRSAYRVGGTPGSRNDYLGFRVVVSPDLPAARQADK